MLEYLVTSKARRRLLDVLWRQGATGPAAQLAAVAGVGFASAYRELQAMQAQGLAEVERKGRAQVYRANSSHPQADAFRAVVAAEGSRTTTDPSARKLRGQLRALGAPLQAESPEPSPGPIEETVARGARLAHRDPDVARTLPVCLYVNRGTLDVGRLRQYARQFGEKRSLGFLLELTADLSGDEEFRAWASLLRDHRDKLPRDFFYSATRSRRGRRVSEERTPPAARRWHWRMNMDQDAFRSTFEKFVPHAT